MNDRAVSLLEQYELEITRTRKGRGAILCETDRGIMIFKEYGGNPGHLKLQNDLLMALTRQGAVEVENLIPTREGELCVKDSDGVQYILKTYRDGRECNIREREECIGAARTLSRLHLCMQEIPVTEGLPVFSMAREYAKRNRELRKIRKYLRARGQKTWFELALLGCFDRFYDQGMEAQAGWESYQRNLGDACVSSYCHGDYQYHNLILGQGGTFLINFEHCVVDDPVRDLYLLLRKLLEKSDWSIPFGEELLGAYEVSRPLPAISRIDLYYRLSYPEKFWKIANFYYNSGKAWIPGRNMEKLERLLAQESRKKEFLENAFRVTG